MSTQNLSAYNQQELPPKEALAGQRYAIAVADWNSDITHSLLNGAIETLVMHGVKRENITTIHVPGTFELTFAAGQLSKSHPKPDAIIVLGCVIQGETPHFDYVCAGATQGIAYLNATTDTPVIYGLITTNDMQQAEDRAGGKLGNKGDECAITAIKMIDFACKLKK